jgi:KaiC/GvpD/RAD55 family RecA-like ATPase
VQDYGPDELPKILHNARRYAKHPAGEKADAPLRSPAHSAGSEPARVGSAVAPLVVISADAGDDDLSDMRSELAAQRDGSRRTIPLPWKRLSDLSNALRPGTVCILAGPPGTGKSFFTAHVARAVHSAEVPWKYLPLEDRRTDFKWRLLAMLAGDYRMIEDDAEGAAWRQENLERFAATLEDMTPHICENPRAGCKDASGKTIVPALPFGAVLDWIGAACEQSARVLFVDPISQIDFEGREPWKAEAEFIRKALALMADAGATLVLVAHTVKRGGKTAALPLTLEDVQGSAMIARLCQCALILDAHDPKQSTVYRPGGLREDVEHNRTILVAKARYASGARQRIAFTQRADAPAFEECGIIAPRGSGEAQSENAEHWSEQT